MQEEVRNSFDEKEIIFIGGNVPSSKNSKVAVKGKGVFNSKAVRRYLQTVGVKKYSTSKKTYENYSTRENCYEKLKEKLEIKKYPIVIGLHLVRKTKASFDFNNVSQIIQDLMVAHGIIVDDNINYVVSVPMSDTGVLLNSSNVKKIKLFSVDKDNPGVYIKIFN